MPMPTLSPPSPSLPGVSAPLSAISQLLSPSLCLLDLFFPLSCIAPLIRLLPSSRLSLVSIELNALIGIPPDNLPPPAELLRLRLFEGVPGREAKKPNPPILWNDSFLGKRPKDFDFGDWSSTEDGW